MSSDKIISTNSFYNRSKRTDRNTINEAKITKPTKSPYTIYNITCTVITAIQEQKDRTYTRFFMILHVITANQIRNGSTYTFLLRFHVNYC
jgi:hypothetical protein